MKRITLIITCLLVISLYGHSQDQQKPSRSFLGLGLGFDYGGIGMKLEYMPIKALGIFGGFGYNLVQPTYNAGASLKLSPGKRGTPVISCMYGYNAAIKIKYAGGTSDGYTYYGVTAGIGFELYNKTLKNKLSCQLLVPFRSSKFRNDYNRFKDQGIKFSNPIPPVAISIGYNFGPKTRKSTSR